MDTTTFKERLDRARQTKRVNQADIARACGISEPSVSAWFSGDAKPRGQNLTKLTAFLGIRSEWLMQGTGHMLPGSGHVVQPLYEDKLSQRGLRIVSRLVEAESANKTDESIYRIIEHALSLALKGAAAEPDVISQEEKQNMVALYEQLPAHRREALISFIKNWMAE